jgi:hypothetical protein
MSGCQHYNGDKCIKCECPTNSCCGKKVTDSFTGSFYTLKTDYKCQKCNKEICNCCYIRCNGCPSCNNMIATDSEIISHLLSKYKLHKSAVTEEVIERKKSRIIVTTANDLIKIILEFIKDDIFLEKTRHEFLLSHIHRIDMKESEIDTVLDKIFGNDNIM